MMRSAVNYMEISQIIFETNDQEVLLRGNTKQGNLSFDSETIITHTQLNELINQLCRMNSSFELENHLQSERMHYGETLFTATLPATIDAKINISELTHFAGVRQIRA